jgi:hypothetical protein
MKKQENPFEGLENLNSIDFELASEMSPAELAINIQKRKGIEVNSVYFPPNFKPNRTKDEAMDWLKEKVKSTKIATYIYKLKYKEIPFETI